MTVRAMSRDRRVRSGGVPPTREDRGSGVKEEESKGRTEEKRESETLEEVIQRQSEKARKFYEQLWKREEEKEQKKREYWRNFDRKMRAMAKTKTKTDLGDTEDYAEITYLRAELVKIYRKYKKLLTRLLDKVEGLEAESIRILRDLMERDRKLLRVFVFVKEHDLKAEILLSLAFKVLLKLTVVTSKPSILKDLKRAYEISRRLSVREGRFNNILAVFEGSTLRALGAYKLHKIVETKYLGEVGATRVFYTWTGKTFTVMYNLKYPSKSEKVRVKSWPMVPFDLLFRITGITVKCKSRGSGPKRRRLKFKEFVVQTPNGRVARQRVYNSGYYYTGEDKRLFEVRVSGSSLTSIGSRDDFDFPFRSDYVGHFDDNGRLVKTELSRALSREERLASFEYGDVQ